MNLSWVTLGDVNAIHERLLREASLSSTTIDVAYLLNGRAVPKNLRLFEPLDALLKEAPIEDFADFAPGLVEPMRVDGALHGIPVRHATNAIVYNEALFEERGVSPDFKTFEDVIEAARKLTFKRDDGTQVYGLAFTPVFASNFLSLSRCLGGDYMTLDRKIVAAEPPMVKAISILADLYKQGVLPRSFATQNNEELVTWIQQGRVAMSVQPYARLVSYNDPQKSRYPGKIKPFLPPMAADLVGKATYAPTVEFWSLVIPKNAKNKKVAWDLIRALSSKQGTVAQALNGNGADTHLDLYRPEGAGNVALRGRRGKGRRGVAHSPSRLRRAGEGAGHLPRGNAVCGPRHEGSASRDGRRHQARAAARRQLSRAPSQ